MKPLYYGLQPLVSSPAALESIGRACLDSAQPTSARVSCTAPICVPTHGREMSLAYRLSDVEAAIPFEDVKDTWGAKRDGWIKRIGIERADANKLASLMLVLLEYLKPKTVQFLWPDDGPAFIRLKETCKRLSNSRTSNSKAETARELECAVKELETVAIPPPPAVERSLLGQGKPLTLALGDDGPDLAEGAMCLVLDIRMVWCRCAPCLPNTKLAAMPAG